MRSRIGACLVAVFLLGVLYHVAAVADVARGDVSGVVSDRSGAMLPGVTVTITGAERHTTVSGPRGDFAFKAVPVGAYVLSFQLAGFKTATTRVTVGTNTMARVSMAMSGGSLAGTATSAPAVKSQAEVRPGGMEGGVAGGIVPAEMQAFAAPQAMVGLGLGFGNGETATYDRIEENGFHQVSADPLSTFSADVDTASYANVRRFLNQGSLPPAGAVRTEELLNYFRYAYPQPTGDQPFSVTTEVTACPWNAAHRLALIGLQGREVRQKNLPDRNLVFLIDVSGSMMPSERLPLVRNALHMLVDTLNARDRVGIVVYAGASGTALPTTSGDRKAEVQLAIAELRAGGSTNGAAGIKLAYQMAAASFIPGGVNRVILATDGDFNVGVTSQDELIRLIELERATGISLSVLGVGTDNLKDSTMQKLADKGNGNYSYLDSLQEARKVLVHEGGGTLVTIAKDVKIQVEFNPATVGAYRLIGYEKRMLRHEDFNDDKKDAGEIGSGHSVTALYEIVPVGVSLDAGSVDPLKYQRVPANAPSSSSGELATVKLRYKAPDGETSRLIAVVVKNQVGDTTARVGFASAVAEFGMLLQGSAHAGTARFESVMELARRYRGEDPEGYRSEFIELAGRAARLHAVDITVHGTPLR